MDPGVLVVGWTRVGDRLRPAIRRPAPVPAEALVAGRSPEEAAGRLPLVFNLCRAAQAAAARLTLGLPPEADADPARDVLRDHLARMFVAWPRAAGVTSTRPPVVDDPGAVRRAVFGAAGRLPDPGGLDAWLRSGEGVAPAVRVIHEAFAPGEAVAEVPDVEPVRALDEGAVENSVAARRRGHPTVASVEARHGRGPAWRALGVLADVEACLDGDLPPAVRLADGTAVVAASRGLYALRARVEGGRVAALARRTPTDHLLAPGGVLERTIAALPAAKAGLLALAVTVLDPCVPWENREAADA